MGLSREAQEKLRAPFGDEELGVLVISAKEVEDETGKYWWVTVAPYITVDQVRERLEEVDPNWHTKFLDVNIQHFASKTGKRDTVVTVLLELSVLGVSRIGGGDGKDARGAISYALKNAASQFGVGRFLTVDPHYKRRTLKVTDRRIYNRLKYGEMNWKELLELIGEKPMAPAPTTAPEATHTETAPQPTPGPVIQAPGPTATAAARSPGLTGVRARAMVLTKRHGLEPSDVLARAKMEGLIDETVQDFTDLTDDEARAIIDNLERWASEYVQL